MRRALLKLWGKLPLPARLRQVIIWLGVTKYLAGVVAVTLNQAGELLLFKHTYRGAYPWGLPSGWLEPREDPQEAIVREIQEETGFEVRVIRPLQIVNDEYVRRLDIIFLCEMTGGTFQASPEVEEARFFKAQDFPDLLPAQYDMIRKIFTTLDPEHTAGGNEGVPND